MSVLYVSDLDGTLLNDEQTVSSEAADMLNSLIDLGLSFTVATARSWESTVELVAGLTLKWPVVLMNGVFIYDPVQGQNIRENYLPPDVGVRIIRDYLAAGLNPIVYTIGQDGLPRIYYRGLFNESEALYVGSRISKGDQRFRLIDSYEGCFGESLLSVNAIDVPERLSAMKDRYSSELSCVCHYGPDIYAPGFHWLEISSFRATKREAVLELKAHYGFERIVCFGDHLNDLSMFTAADEKYAVSNAHELAKQAADRVIASNNELGVPRFLKARFEAESSPRIVD